MAQLDINVSNIAPSVAREPIPANGWVKAIIVESELVPSKKDPEFGRRLNFTFKVVEGEYAGRPFFGGLNIINKSPVAQQIAREDLSAIGHAVGVLDIKDSSLLHNLPMWVKIKYVAATEATASDPAYDAKNEPCGYKKPSEKVDPMTPIRTVLSSASVAPSAAFIPPTAAFVPPTQAPAAAGEAPAWQAPAAAQPWTPPVEAAVAAVAPVAPAVALTAPAAVVAAAAIPVQAANPAAPPWEQPVAAV